MKVASFFSGAGGLDYGFKKPYFDLIFANDFNYDACQSYIKNNGNHIFHGDFYEAINEVPHVDIIIGGPPCQGFSVAGKMDDNDERNKLIVDYFNFIKQKKPLVFVCENVKNLYHNPRWLKVREQLFSIVDNDYHLFKNVLNSSEYGVSQKRERFFIIGFSKEKFSSDIIEKFTENLNFQKEKPKILKELLSDLKDNPLTCNAKVVYVKNPVLRTNSFGGYLFNGSGRPVNANHYSMTLVATMGGNRTPIIDTEAMYNNKPDYLEDYYAELKSGGKIREGTPPDFIRRLTINECKRIQSFPDNYYFYGKNCSVYRQIGNAVPCKLSEKIANAIKNTI